MTGEAPELEAISSAVARAAELLVRAVALERLEDESETDLEPFSPAARGELEALARRWLDTGVKVPNGSDHKGYVEDACARELLEAIGVRE